jgi:hypothetical protein
MRRPTVALSLVPVMILTAAGCMPRDARAQSASAGLGAARVLAVDSALAEAAKRDLWPGFAPLRLPLAIYDQSDSYLFRHPNPPARYRPLPGAPGVYVMSGLDPAITANSSAQLGGMPTATIHIVRAGRWQQGLDAGLAMHELFHVFQRTRHPSWVANEADLFTYPFDRADGLALRREETDALIRAFVNTVPDVAVGVLTAENFDSMRCWARGFADVRARRFALIGAEAAAYERGTELNEGLAHYVELRATRLLPFMKPGSGDSSAARARNGAGEFVAEAVRQRAYEVGAAMGRVLDQLQPDWRARLETAVATPTPPLDAMLASAAGPEGRVCSAGAAQRTAWARAAEQDVEGIRAAHAAARTIHLDRAGWRVVVDAPNTPLFPQGFDPLNVTRLSPSEVLHTRFLQLQGGSGSLKLLGVAALTEGTAGAHPLFAGVRRVTITGLEAPPLVRDSVGTAVLEAPGLTARLRGVVDTTGQTIRIRLP